MTNTRQEILNDLLSTVEDYGLDSEKISAFSTVSFLLELLMSKYDKDELLNTIRYRERFVSTAEKHDSLVRHAADEGYTIQSASISETKVSLFINENDYMSNASGVTSKISFDIPKDIIFKFDTILFKLYYNIRITKNVDKNTYYGTYVVDELNPIKKTINPFINISRVRYLGEWYLKMQIDIGNYFETDQEHYYINEINSFQFNSYFDNQLVDFKIQYKDPGEEYRDINKALFTDASATGETLFYSVFSNYIKFINKYSTGNLTPIPNGLFKITTYTTNGSSANFDTYTDIVNIDTGDLDIKMYAESISSSTNGKDTPTDTKFRENIKIKKRTRDSIRTEPDMRYYLNNNANDGTSYSVVKVRNSFLELIYAIYLNMKYDNTNFKTTTIPMTVWGTMASDGVELMTATDSTLGKYKYICYAPYTKYTNGSSYYTSSNYLYHIGKDRVMSFFQININKLTLVSPFHMSYDIERNLITVYEGVIDKTFNTPFKYINENTNFGINTNNINITYNGKDDIIRLGMYISAASDDIKLSELVNGGIVNLDNIRIVLRIDSDISISVNLIMVNLEDDVYYYEGYIKGSYIYNGYMHVEPNITEYIPYTDMTKRLRLSNLTASIDIYKKDKPNILKDDVVIESDEYTDIYNFGVDIDNPGYSKISTLGVEGFELFNDLSQNMNIQVTDIVKASKQTHYIKLDKVPMVYYKDNLLKLYKSMIANYTTLSDSSFKSDPATRVRMNFIANYGYSYLYKIKSSNGYDEFIMDLNAKLRLDIKMVYNYTTTEEEIIQSTKDYISSIDFTNGNSFHTSELIVHLKNKYKDISYIDFMGIGLFDQSFTYIYMIDDIDKTVDGYKDDYKEMVPELLDFEVVVNFV